MLLCNDQLAEIISQQISGYVQEPKMCPILCWSAQQCCRGRKHYLAKIRFAGSSLCFSCRFLRSQGLQEESPNNILTLICWSLIKTAFLIGEKKNSANTIGKICRHYHLYRNHRKLFLCICAPSTGFSAFTERSQRKFCHLFQWEQKRGVRTRYSSQEPC